MKVLAALDSIFRRHAAEYEPWFPEPDRGVRYHDDGAWQQSHLWDSMLEDSNGFHGPYRGPTILHHPDLQYALDNGWRVMGGPKQLDHQARGETSSGSTYLYKIGKDGLIHKANLGIGPEEAHHMAYEADDDVDRPGGFDSVYGDVPDNNWRHLIMGEGSLHEGPEQHATLRDLVDDETARSMDPKREGYKDFQPLTSSGMRVPGADPDWGKKWQHTVRRAWETGTNDPGLHWNDPIPDPYADIDNIPRAKGRGQEPAPREDYGGPAHSRYGANDDPNRSYSEDWTDEQWKKHLDAQRHPEAPEPRPASVKLPARKRPEPLEE